jgi:tetratricopeptide (TPR) repeat protein
MIQSNNHTESTQPGKPATRRRRAGRFLLNALILVALLALGIFGGYQSAISARRNAESSSLMEQLGEQFQYALVDLEFGRYEIARQRLEFIIEKDPSFPGAQEKLTEVLVQINLQANYVPPTIAEAMPSPTATPDFSGAEEAYTHAQQLIAAQDWAGALGALDALRKLDPAYKTSQVDGMYYFALRNNGYDLITRQGNLEGGIYYLTLAERFGLLDSNALGVREGARYYLRGASYWELDWEKSLEYFSQVYTGWPGLWDGTLTASDRYRIGSMRYGDQLFAQERFCDALIQYDNAQRLGPLDQTAGMNYTEALLGCYPPTATLDPSLLFTPTTDIFATPTETIPVIPTETPTPSETPTP